jgi:hypothetical protein
MNTDATSMEVPQEEEGTIAAAYQDYLQETGEDDSPEMAQAFYAGAQALFQCATPLWKMAILHQEIEDFFDAQ